MCECSTQFPPQAYSSAFRLDCVPECGNGVAPRSPSPPVTQDLLITTVRCMEGPQIRPRDSPKPSNVDKSGEPEESQVWHPAKTIRSPSPHNAFKRWRKSRLFDGRKASVRGQGAPPDEDDAAEEMSLLKFLAFNALDLSLPASPVLLKTRNSHWFQLSGHPDSLAPAGPGTVWKKRSPHSDDTERLVYEELLRDPVLQDIVPKYYREVEYQGERFIELQDLLHGFQDPYVIDIKMGTRTFLESEVRKTTARADLYHKMVAIDASAPTAEEHRQQAVTKLRYMQFRELQSSTCSQGFRIEAMKCRGSAPVTDLKTVKSSAEVLHTLDVFLGGREDVRQRLVTRLYDIRAKIDQSEYFKTREVVGSSLFIVYDDVRMGAWLIDFAKTNRLPEGRTVNHRTPWVQGNYEEGLLFGFDRLISILETIRSSEGRRRPDRFTRLSAVSVES